MKNFTFLQREFSNTTVKSLFWLTWLLLFGILPAKAQVATNYGFSQLSGTFTPITGGILLGTETTDDQRFLDPAVPAGGTVTTGVGLPIGFDFTFNDQVYNRVAVNANGWISFGNSSLTPAVNNASTSAYTPLASTTATTPTHLRNRISALGADLQAQTGASLRIETIGDAPNRVCVIQWLNYRRWNETGHNLNFQIRLNETTNIVDIVYGTMTFNSTSYTAHVGLGGSLATDFNNRLSTTDWNTTTAGTANTSTVAFSTSVTPPVSGTTFRWALQSCIWPSLQATTDLTNTMAVVNWNEPNPTPSLGYDWELRTSGQPGSGTTGLLQSGSTNSGTTSLNLVGLTSNTTYFFYIRSICTSTESSAWASTQFTTQLVLPTPYLEPFATTTTPVGYAITGWAIGATRGVTGNPGNNIYINLWSSTTSGTFNTVTMGPVLANQSLTFDYKHSNFSEPFDAPAAGAGSFNVQLSTNFGATYTTVETIQVSNTNTWQSFSFDLTPYVGQTIRMRIQATWVSGDFDLAFDNIMVASCLQPLALSTSALTSTSVNLNWTASVSNPADGYQWEVRTSGAAGSGATGLVQSGSVAAGITTASVSGLTSATLYQFYVRAICSTTDNSVWIQGPNFTTLCNPVTEFTQNFDSATVGALPVCWSRAGSSTIGNVVAGAVAPFSAPNQLQLSAAFQSTVSFVLMPPVSNLQADTHRLRFRAFSTSAARNLDVGYFTDESDLSTFTVLVSIPMPSTTAAVSEEYFVEPTGIPAGVTRLVFRNLPSEAGTAVINIDNVIWQAIPSCLNPTIPTASSITNVSAQLQWIANAGEVEWDIKYGTPGFNPASEGTLISGIFDNPYTLTGLAPSTTYAYFVRAVCDSSSTSPWEGPISFTTLCNPFTIPFFEGFEIGFTHNTAVAGCYSQASITGTAVWTANNTLTDFNRAPRTGAWNAFLQYSNEDWLFIPVQLTGGTSYTLQFYARQDGAVAANSNISASFGNTNNAGGMTNVIVPTTGLINGNYQEFIGNFTPTSTGIYFVGIKGFMNGTPWYISLDDISIIQTPACPAPLSLTATSISTSTATLGWTSNASQLSWEIEYGLTGFTQGSGTIVAASTNPFVLTGLLPNTTYQFYVRAVCAGSTFSNWSSVTSFTTACESISSFPFNETFEANSTTRGCWTNQQVAGNANWTFATGAGGGAITTAFQGTLNARFVSVSGTATPTTRLVSPILNLTGLTTPQLKFHYGQEVWFGDQNTLKVYYRVDQNSSWVEIANYTGNIAVWTLAELNLPNPSATYQIAFEGINNWGRANVIDNVVVEETLSMVVLPTNQLAFYPNPVKDVLNLVNNTIIERVEIYNLLGQQVMQVKTNATQASVHVGELAKGAYIVKAYANGAEQTFKIIKN